MNYKLRAASTPRLASSRNTKPLAKNDKDVSSGIIKKSSPGPVMKQWMTIKKSVLSCTSRDKVAVSGKKVRLSSSSPPVARAHCEAKEYRVDGQNNQTRGPCNDVSYLKRSEYTREAPPTSVQKSMSNKIMNVIQKLNPIKMKSFFRKSKSDGNGDVIQAEILKHQYSRANFPKWQEKEFMQSLKHSPRVESKRILAFEEKWLATTQQEGGQDRLRLFEDRYFSQKWACLHGTMQGFEKSCYYSKSGELVKKAYRDSPVELGQEMHSFEEVVYPYSYSNYMKYMKNNEYDMDERPTRVMRVGVRKNNAHNACERMRSNRTKCPCNFHSLY